MNEVSALFYRGSVIIGKNGVRQIVEIRLNSDEQEMFDKSVAAVEGAFISS